jgi:hypothetical protein
MRAKGVDPYDLLGRNAPSAPVELAKAA